jgi:hypothetical protein
MMTVLAISRGRSTDDEEEEIHCALSNVVAHIKQHVHLSWIAEHNYLCGCGCLRCGINGDFGDIDGVFNDFNMHTVVLQSLRRPVGVRFHVRITIEKSFQGVSRVAIVTPVR